MSGVGQVNRMKQTFERIDAQGCSVPEAEASLLPFGSWSSRFAA
jgi:hypothetical protein